MAIVCWLSAVQDDEDIRSGLLNVGILEVRSAVGDITVSSSPAVVSSHFLLVVVF